MDGENKASRRWVFTHWLKHNQSVEKVLETFGGLVESDLCRYGVAQVEGPNDEGKNHLQGYLELNRPARMTQLKGVLWNTTRWQIAKGTGRKNLRYCTKTHEEPYEWPDEKVMRLEGTEPVIFGEMGGRQGTRSDLDEVKRMLDDGEPMSAVATEFFGDFVRYHRGFSEYRKVRQQLNRGKPTVEVLWGESATGKSLYCRTMYEPSEEVFYLTKPNGKGRPVWWDGYDGHKVVVIDEFYGWMAYDMILRLLDYGPLNVETKGGSVPMVADHFVFTSNTRPEEWYRLYDKPDEGAPFLRRLAEFAVVTETSEQYLDAIVAYIETDDGREEARTLGDSQ